MRNADVIIVDNDPDDAELTTYALKADNTSLKVIYFKNGVDVLNYLSEESEKNQHVLSNLKLILLDLKIPKMDGFEILRRIRQNEQTFNIPVVILTSSQERKNVLEAFALGANSYMIKPVGFDLFVRTVSAMSHYWTRINVSSTQDFRTDPKLHKE